MSKENTIQITQNSIATNVGPSEWFTGTVYVDTVAAPSGQSRLTARSIHFTPGARTAWHTHPTGQTIYVTELSKADRCKRASDGGDLRTFGWAAAGDRAGCGLGAPLSTTSAAGALGAALDNDQALQRS